MIDCLSVARYFIMRAYEDGMEAEMTNIKVQKLLYYSQSLHLALYDEPLFKDEIEAWRYGLKACLSYASAALKAEKVYAISV